MDVRVKFLGGAQTVTGSRYLLEIDDFRLLIDCGLFQGLKEYRLRNWDDFPIDPKTIDAVVLTHAHIDHSGYLPKLVREGYNGPIYCTEATEALMQIMLLDSAKLQEEEADYAKKKGYSRHKNPEPLYNQEDAKRVFEFTKMSGYEQPRQIAPNISVVFHNAGHILGSAIVALHLEGNTQHKKLIFSGDLGRDSNPLLENPAIIKEADILWVESTYGDRKNKVEDPEQEIAEHVHAAMERGGCLLIPAFTVGRTQMIAYYLRKLMMEGRIPKVPIYLDSPMAISVTQLYRQLPSYHKLQKEEIEQGDCVFDYPQFHYVRNREGSAALNDVKRDAIIISASGMCTGGRILHHLYHRLPRENDTLLFVGYQAEGTRGRDILEGREEIKMFGEYVNVKCHVDEVEGFSAHADMEELHQWVQHFASSPKLTFIVHGERRSAETLQKWITDKLQWNVFVPAYLESFSLFENI